MRRQNGITLVALIITIIILLILAVVAISAVSNDGIFNHAQKAANDWEAAQVNEQQYFDHANSYIDKMISSNKYMPYGNNYY